MRIFSLLSCVVLVCLSAGCLFNKPAPSPNLTPAQQQSIEIALTIQQDADLANVAFQSVAAFQPKLMADAKIAAEGTASLDTLVGQYVADISNGVTPGTLMAQINADLSRILELVGNNPPAAAEYTKAKAKVARAKH